MEINAESVNKKKYILYLDEKSIPESIGLELIYSAFDDTEKAIWDLHLEVIHTTSLASLTFDLLKLGYEIHVVRNNKDVVMYPGMDSKGGKDLRMEHNLQRLVMGGYFDKDFE